MAENKTKEVLKAEEDAIFQNNIARMFSDEVVYLDPSKIRAIREDDPRLKAEIPPSFIENIRVNGQIEPGLVYKLPTEDGSELYAVIAGLQRLRTIRMLNREGANRLYAARVADPSMTDLNQLVVACATNEARVAQTPMQKAYWLVRLLDGCNGNNSAVARRAGVDEGTVRNARTLIEKATPSLQKAVETGAVAVTTAVNIIKDAKGDDAKQVAKAEEALRKFDEKANAKPGEKPPKKTSISASEIEAKKPSAGRLKRLIALKGVPAQVASVIQWIIGEVSADALAAAVPWFGAANAELAAEDAKAATEAAEKAKQREAEAEERKKKAADKKAEKERLKAEEAALSPEEREQRAAERKRQKLLAELEKLSASGKTASSVAAKTKPPAKKK